MDTTKKATAKVGDSVQVVLSTTQIFKTRREQHEKDIRDNLACQ